MSLRSRVIELDRRLLSGALMHEFHSAQVTGTLRRTIDHRYLVHYNKDHNNLFSALCDKYGSDKGQIKTDGHPYTWAAHTYADFYADLYDHCRDSVRRVFECGLGTYNPQFAANMGPEGKPGASLRVWRDYFPNATIYGADIDETVLFSEERIETFALDQTDPSSIKAMWSRIGSDFDLIVDDGLHTFEGGRCLFEHSFSQLRPGGIYAIEDVSPTDLRRYQAYFVDKEIRAEFVNLFRPENGLRDNSLVVLRK